MTAWNHRHYQTRGFFSGDALPDLYCSCLHFMLVLEQLNLQFFLQPLKHMLNWIQVRWLTWPFQNILLFHLGNVLGCFKCILQVVVHLHCPPICFEAFSRMWADNIWLYTLEFILSLMSEVTSMNSWEPVPLLVSLMNLCFFQPTDGLLRWQWQLFGLHTGS